MTVHIYTTRTHIVIDTKQSTKEIDPRYKISSACLLHCIYYLLVIVHMQYIYVYRVLQYFVKKLRNDVMMFVLHKVLGKQSYGVMGRCSLYVYEYIQKERCFTIYIGFRLSISCFIQLIWFTGYMQRYKLWFPYNLQTLLLAKHKLLTAYIRANSYPSSSSQSFTRYVYLYIFSSQRHMSSRTFYSIYEGGGKGVIQGLYMDFLPHKRD